MEYTTTHLPIHTKLCKQKAAAEFGCSATSTKLCASVALIGCPVRQDIMNWLETTCDWRIKSFSPKNPCFLFPFLPTPSFGEDTTLGNQCQ